MKKLALVLSMFIFAAFCSCSSDTEEEVTYRIYTSESDSNFKGNVGSEVSKVYDSISEGLQEFEAKYGEEWRDIAKDKDYAAGDKVANSKFDAILNNFKNFEISINDKIANLPTTTEESFTFTGKLLLTRVSLEREEILQEYSCPFVFPQ